MLTPFLAPEASISKVGGRIRVTLPDGRYFAFAIGGFEWHNPNAKPLPENKLLKDFLDKRAGQPGDDPESA